MSNENKKETDVDIKLANSFGTLKSVVKVKRILKSITVLILPTMVKRSLSACFFAISCMIFLH